MKMSHLFGTTLREAPAGARSASQGLLTRAGFVRPADHGRYTCLPLAVRSIARIESLARAALERLGGQAISVTLAPGQTLDQAVANLCATDLKSWRQLPKVLFHTHLPSLTDAPARDGLLSTGTGWIASVSMDADGDGQVARYLAHQGALKELFSACGLTVITVESARGSAEEAAATVCLSAHGPDVIVRCPGCGYAAELGAARFLRTAVDPKAAPRPVEKVATPECPTIEDLAAFLKVGKRNTAKAVLLMATVGPQRPERFVFAVVRGDRDLSEGKLLRALQASRLRPATDEEIRAAGAVPGYASPVGLPLSTFVIVDEEVAGSANLVAGANQEGYHLLHTNIPRDYTPSRIADIARAAEGDRCHSCGTAALTFHTGVKIAELRKAVSGPGGPARATFQDRGGTERPLHFGWCEIALDRLLALVAEEHHDDRGLLWPARVAPFDVHLVSLGAAGGVVGDEAERVYRELEAAGCSVLFDDRDERPGVKFADADLIGAPIRLTVSERSVQAGGVEMKLRREESKAIVASASVVTLVAEKLRY